MGNFVFVDEFGYLCEAYLSAEGVYLSRCLPSLKSRGAYFARFAKELEDKKEKIFVRAEHDKPKKKSDNQKMVKQGSLF